jgi:hypothetical protein
MPDPPERELVFGLVRYGEKENIKKDKERKQ